MATKLILIRHGQTDWNLKKRYCGFIDKDINKTGRNQAKKICACLKNEAIHKVYSSDRKRAINTAKIIFKNLRIEKIPQLRELHFGIFEGLTYEEITRKYSQIYAKWLNKPYSITIPKGEHLRKFEKRIIKAFKKILIANKDKTIAVICHGGTISVFLNHISKTKNFWGKIPSSASISILEHKNGKTKLQIFNKTNHLK